MSEIAKRLRERRQNVWNEAKELADRAAEENRAFTAEEQGTWDQLNEELDKLDTRIKAVLDGEKRSKEADEAFDRLAGKPGVTERRDGSLVTPAEKDLAEQFRKLARGEIRSFDVGLPSVAERNAAVERRGLGRIEFRTPLMDSTANMPLPITFISQLYQYLVDTSSIRGVNPTVYTTTSGENLTVPRSTAEGSATWFAEGAQITESNPTLSSVTLSAYKVGKTIYCSSELVADTGFDLLGFIAQHAGRNIGIAVDTGYVAGTGTGQPTGLLSTATTISMGTGTAGADPFATVKAGPLFDAYHGVLPQYRPRASWLMQDNTIKLVRKITDSTGQYLWQPGLTLGAPDTLLGRPVYADPNMQAAGVTGRSIIAFGDFGGYWIRDVTPLRFDRSDDFKFDTDVISFRALYRTDGKQGDTQALRVLTTLT
jgi:HK97 family phage major capsid protein